jgi:flavin-dependent dehydrogenase
MPNPTDYDVVIIGGGPGGSTTATLLAKYGHKVLVVERAEFPRFHIGESLLPETYWTFKRLDMLDKMKSSHFVKKYSVQFVSPTGKETAPFYFDEHNPHECSQTWQVLRSEFDTMMLQNAAEHGVEVWQPANVAEILLEPSTNDYLPKATGVKVERIDPATGKSKIETLKSKIVVDATGTNALLSKKLGIRHIDPKLKKAAVFSHYKNAAREPGKNGGATLVIALQNQTRGWFWYIPLANGITSVGVVADLDYLIGSRDNPEQTLQEEIAICPAVATRIANAQREGPIHVLQDFSYRANRCAGDGWVLVGDAFGFLDPMYSSGVFLALKSGEMAADTIHDALEKNDTSAESLSRWGQDLSDGMTAIRKLVYAYYTPGFSFGRFLKNHPHFKGDLTDLLIGNVFHCQTAQRETPQEANTFRPEATEVFNTMSQSIPLPDPVPLKTPAHAST